VSSKQQANLLTHRAIEKLYPVEILDSLWGILISIGVAIGFTMAVLLYVQDAATTIFSGIIISIIPIAGPVIASLGLFQTWDKNRKEDLL
jgi:hypothetical protein